MRQKHNLGSKGEKNFKVDASKLIAAEKSYKMKTERI